MNYQNNMTLLKTYTLNPLFLQEKITSFIIAWSNFQSIRVKLSEVSNIWNYERGRLLGQVLISHEIICVIWNRSSTHVCV